MRNCQESRALFDSTFSLDYRGRSCLLREAVVPQGTFRVAVLGLGASFFGAWARFVCQAWTQCCEARRESACSSKVSVKVIPELNEQ